VNSKAIEPISDAIPPRAPVAVPSAAAIPGPGTTANPGGLAAAAAPRGGDPLAATPAATVSLTQIPASVATMDRTLYLQILAAVGGDATAALAVLRMRRDEAAARPKG
jgi:hypothetical protein